MKKLLICILLLSGILLLVLTAPICAEGQKVTFWTLPDPEPAAFWTDSAKDFMAVNPGIQVDVRAIAEAPTSEAVLLTAIAGGTAPTAAGGIFNGFAVQLAEAGAIVPLDSLPGWDELIKNRSMKEAIKAWQFPDGHFYILPIYSNPMLFSWRTDVLKELGVDLPRTYSQVSAVAAKFMEKYPDNFLMAYKRLGSTSWYYRWYDFFPLYEAASDGQPFLTGNEITADDKAAIEVFKFFADLSAAGYLLPRDVPDAFPTKFSIWRPCGPWELPRWAESFPEMKYDESFIVAPPPIPTLSSLASIQHPKTFADAKGYVLLAQSSKEDRQAAWEFLKWVLSNPENDLKWAEMTGMLPVRDDLSTNIVFKEFFKQHPELTAYAESIPYAIPALMHAQYADIYLAIGEEGFLPIINGEKTPEQAWQDVKDAIERIFAE